MQIMFISIILIVEKSFNSWKNCNISKSIRGNCTGDKLNAATVTEINTCFVPTD